MVQFGPNCFGYSVGALPLSGWSKKFAIMLKLNIESMLRHSEVQSAKRAILVHGVRSSSGVQKKFSNGCPRRSVRPSDLYIAKSGKF